MKLTRYEFNNLKYDDKVDFIDKNISKLDRIRLNQFDIKGHISSTSFFIVSMIFYVSFISSWNIFLMFMFLFVFIFKYIIIFKNKKEYCKFGYYMIEEEYKNEQNRI